MNLQDAFLNKCRLDKMKITIFLNSGYKLGGKVLGFDNYVIFFETEKGEHLIYKSSIASISPSKHIRLFTKEDEKKD